MVDKDANGSHLISDALWEQIEPLLPPEIPNPNDAQPPVDSRKAMEAILYALRTGCKWDDLPSDLGAKNTVYRRFQEWRRTGAFDRMWQAGILTYDELQALIWQGKNYKAP
jgi:putative transposase